MERLDTTCVHCIHVFDLDNLKSEKRRSVGKRHSDVDLIKTLSFCYDLDELNLRNAIGFDESSYFVCDSCFNNLRSIFLSLSKCNQLKSKLSTRVSPSYRLLCDNLTVKDEVQCETVDCEISSLPLISEHEICTPYVLNSNRKRPRCVFTPTKSGLTPKSKRQTQPKTPRAKSKKNRRRLHFTPFHSEDGKETPNVAVQSPGPKVKVQLEFKGSCRQTDLKGPGKLACRSIVQKQYKTALNHLLKIDDAKKELASTVRKTVAREVQNLCHDKDSVFRGSNIKNFSWKSAHKELQQNCPVTIELLKIICGNNKTEKLTPRLISSVGIMLFNRNQQMNAIQSINSVLMFRGHVRTRVYSTFNRAGFSSSYKSTLSTIDKICESFDIPVKTWAKAVSVQYESSGNVRTSTNSTDEHNYAQLTETEDVICDMTPDHSYTLSPPSEVPQTPINSTVNYTCPDMDSPFTTSPEEAAIAVKTSFEIVMDNLNMVQKTRYKTLETGNKTHNLTHSIAVQHRVTDNTKDATLPQADILSVHNEAFVPNHEDYEALYADFKVLIQRTLVEHIPALKDYHDLVEFHIPHPYSKESSKKSNVIPLGILEKDENLTEQMVEIVEHLQQYVPRTTHNKMIPILLGGDALSVERGEAARRARSDSFSPEDRLDGLVWKSEDWHGHVISLQETFNFLYKGTSSGEKGTLFQLRNLFDRRGVKSEVKNSVNDCREFLRFVTKGYIILAALKLLGLSSLDQFESIKTSTEKEEQKSFLEKLSSDIVSQFIATEEFKFEQTVPEQTRTIQRVPCGYLGCPKSFAVDGRCRQKHRDSCMYKHFTVLNENETNNISPPEDVSDSASNISKDDHDFKFNYVCNVLREGLMDWNREDASKENDGDRIIRLWRFDMLKFFMTHHTKYCLLGFKLQSQIMALLTPRLAFELKHNRSVNIHGGEGGNVPGDLALEFMNMRAKDALNALHGNLTCASIQRAGRSLQGCNHIIDAYTKGLDQFFGKPSNWKPTIKKDIETFVKELCSEDLFNRKPGRHFRSFQNINFETLDKLDRKKLSKWLTMHKEECAKLQRTRSYVI